MFFDSFPQYLDTLKYFALSNNNTKYHLYYMSIYLCVCFYLQVMAFRRMCQMVVSQALESLQVSPQ